MTSLVYNPYWFLLVVLIIQPLNGYLLSKDHWIWPVVLMIMQAFYLARIAFSVDWKTF